MNSSLSHLRGLSLGRVIILAVVLLLTVVLSDRARATLFTYDNTTAGGISSTTTPCSNPLSRTFSVTDSFTIAGMYVGLNIDHTYRSDVEITLRSPAGTAIQIVALGNDSGNNFDSWLYDNAGATFAGSVGLSQPTGAPIYEFPSQPTNPLSGFNGENANGTWTMELCDTFSADNGTFNSARLVFFDGDNGGGAAVGLTCSIPVSRLDWDLVDYAPAGALSESFAVTNASGPTVTANFVTTGATGFISSPFPDDDTTFNGGGGVSGNSESLVFIVDPPDSSTTSAVTQTVTFSQAVTDFRFSVFDIDSSNPFTSDNGRQDQVTVIGFNGATQVLPVMVQVDSNPSYEITSNVALGMPFDTSSSGNTRGTVDVYFPAAVTSVQVIYEEAATALDPFGRGIGIGDLAFCPIPPAPPVAVNDMDAGNTTGSAVTVAVLDNDSDVNNDIDPGSVQISGTAAAGDPLVAINEGVWSVDSLSGAITFTPCTAAGVPDVSCSGPFTGDPAPISYTVADTGGLVSNTASVTVDYVQTDFGDAPASYGSASHAINTSLLLGAAVDADLGDWFDTVDANFDASDDDVEGPTPDDEDIVASAADFPLLTSADTSYTITGLPVVNSTGSNAFLVAWIDFNNNGTFDGGEQSQVTTVLNGATSADLSWPAVSFPVAGSSFIRLRLSSASGFSSMPAATGNLSDGEVEDHPIEIQAAMSVIKQTLPDGENTSFNVTIDGAGPFALTDNVSSGFVAVTPGIPVTVFEESVGGSGSLNPFNLAAYQCVDALGSNVDFGLTNTTVGSGNNVTSHDFSITVPAVATTGAQQTITCTLFNVKAAELTFVKTASPADTTNFDFTVTEPASVTTDFDFTLDGEATDTDADTFINQLDQEFDTSNTGTLDYTVAENVPAEWQLTNIACVNLSGDLGAIPNVAAGELALALDPGDQGICTFTNVQQGRIIVDKVATPAGDTTQFAFTPSYAAAFTLADTDAPNDSGLLDPGTYSVTETVPAGWMQLSAVCDDGSDPSSITLNPGETVTCTFTNSTSPPIAVDDAASTVEDTAVDINVVANDSDPDGNLDPTTANTGCATCSGPANGSLVNNGDGTFTYTPNSDFVGTDTFVYEICDTFGVCDTATVTITVTDEGSPDAVDDTATTTEDMAVDVPWDDNDSLIDGALLTPQVGDLSPANGTVVVNDGGTPADPTDDTFTYTPDAGFAGVDTFTYTVCDDDSPTPTCDSATVAVTVIDEGSPDAVDDTATTTEDTAVDVPWDDNDSLIDGALLDSFTQPSNGTVTSDDGGTPNDPSDDTFTYTPNTGFAGTDTFTYTICDDDTPTATCDTATVTVTVTDEGSPDAVDDTATTTEDTAVDVPWDDNDDFTDGALLDSFTQPTNGTVTSDDGGTPNDPSDDTFTYTPNTGFAGTDTFTYTICDDDTPTATCDTATVTVTVTDEGSPDAVDDTATTIEDTAVDVPWDDNDDFTDGALLDSFTQPSNGTVTSDDGGTPNDPSDDTFTYTPNTGFAGTDTFTYTICDDDTPTATCDTATVTVTVTDEGSPDAVDDTASTNQDTAVDIPWDDNDDFTDGALLDSFTQPSNGTVTSDDGGTPNDPSDDTFTYTPDTGFTGTDTFTYIVCDDDTPATCDSATITVTVNATSVRLNVRMMLQGALLGVESAVPLLMRDELRAEGHLQADALTEPYTALTQFTHVGGGAETIADPLTVLADSGADSVVDWVFVELRDAAAPATVVATRSGLLQRDGDVVDVDGVSSLEFSQAQPGSYYVAVRHRNHIGTMTAMAIPLASSGTLVDFTDPLLDLWHNQALFDGVEQKTVGSITALWAGNTNVNASVVFAGQENDPDPVFNEITQAPMNVFGSQVFVFIGYHLSDVNLSGEAIFAGQDNDVDPVFNNVTTHPKNVFGSQVFVISEQLAE